MTRVKFEPAVGDDEPETGAIVLRPGEWTVYETDNGAIELRYWPAPPLDADLATAS